MKHLMRPARAGAHVVLAGGTIALARSRWVGIAAIIAGALCGCGTQPSPTGDDAPAPACRAGHRRRRRGCLPIAPIRGRGGREQSALCRRALLVRRGLRSRDRLRRADRSRELGEAPIQAHPSAGGDLSRHGRAQEPIVFLNGGPGAPSRLRTADEIRAWLGLLWSEGWTHRRDFIVIAQRGTNWTDSNLSCPALRELWRRLDRLATIR